MHSELHKTDGSTALRVKALRKPLIIDVSDFDSYTVPCLLGFFVTSTQVALLRDMATPALCDGLLSIVKSIDADDISDGELTSVMFKDARALKRLLLT